MRELPDCYERRYEVFFSSTYEDLKDIRKSLMEETAKIGNLASGMEFFPRGARDVDLIEARIRSADVFVLLVGARYGSKVKQQDAHFIDLEYDIAMRLNKPILVYLLNAEEYRAARESLSEGDPERNYDTQLKAFRERVHELADGTGRIVGTFSLLGDHNALLKEFDQDLDGVINALPSGGWVRGKAYDDLRSRVALERSVSANHFFVKFISEFNKFNVLSDRTEQQTELKTSIAKFFLEQYLGEMIERGFHKFFFESGSSVAYLSQEFIKLLREKAWLSGRLGKLELHTNNILSYIDFTLTERIQIELFPYGPPEKKYGATFGPLTSLTELRPPLKPRPLTAAARSQVNKVTEWIAGQYRKQGLIFMTASGLERSPHSPFYGPHVGSYYNMLFKRALLAAKCPTVILLDEKKVLDSPFRKGICYPPCDHNKKGTVDWSFLCKNSPLAIALGCASEARCVEVESVLNEMGFNEIEKQSSPQGISAIIASNKPFTRIWGLR